MGFYREADVQSDANVFCMRQVDTHTVCAIRKLKVA